MRDTKSAGKVKASIRIAGRVLPPSIGISISSDRKEMGA
jgi:hypothetical protein